MSKNKHGRNEKIRAISKLSETSDFISRFISSL